MNRSIYNFKTVAVVSLLGLLINGCGSSRFVRQPTSGAQQVAQVTLFNEAFTIGARQFRDFSFDVNNPIRLSGKFRAEGGRGNDIECMVLDSDAYQNWITGHTVSTVYNSGRATVGTINATLPKGHYFVVFNNRFSILTSKAVTASVFSSPV